MSAPTKLVMCVCTQCGSRFGKERGQLNRALRASPGRLFCSRECTGLARRNPDALYRQPLEVRRARKAAYDAIRRAIHGDELRAQKRQAYHDTFDPERARLERLKKKARNPNYHTDYCRRYFQDPKRKAAKVAYDLKRRDARFGEFAESAQLLRELQGEIRARVPSDYERRKARGYYLKPTVQERKRNEGISRW